MWPKSYFDPEYVIPSTADLRGIEYDPANQCIITYDQTEGKVLWIQKNSGNILLSAQCPLQGPYIDKVGSEGVQITDMTLMNDVLYILAHLGNGVLGIYVGSLQEGRDKYLINTMEYLVPAYRQVQPPLTSPQDIWTATHDGSMRYLKYHPKYCSILHKGTDLYLLLGMSNNITSNAPPEQGQFLVAYDLAGFFYKFYKVDDTTGYTASNISRPSVTDPNKLNGMGVMACYHDGIISLVTEGVHSNDPLTGANKILKAVDSSGSGTGSLEVSTQPFVTGPFRIGDSMSVVGRYAFFLVGNRIIQADVYMLETFCNHGADFFSAAIDMGVVASGQVMRRQVFVVNRSPYYTYTNLNIESKSAKISIARVAADGSPEIPFTDRIKIPGSIAMDDEISFFVQLTAPIFTEDNIVKNFYDQLSYKFDTSW